MCVCYLDVWCHRGLFWERMWLVVGECPECGVMGLLDATCGFRGFIVVVWFKFWWGLLWLGVWYAYGVFDGDRVAGDMVVYVVVPVGGCVSDD